MTQEITQGYHQMWAGTPEEHVKLLEASASARAAFTSGNLDMKAMDGDGEAFRSLVTDVNSTRIISIKGPMVSQAQWWHRYVGIASYPVILQALVDSFSDRSVKRVILDMATGGGEVDGIAQVNEAISRLASVKPVITCATGGILSAGYWIGSSATRVFASETSLVGSIGVILTHTEYSRMLENNGIKVTSIRSGQFKALGQPHEPLTEAATKQLQDMVDSTDALFVGHVARSRGRSVEYVREYMAQGRVMLAGLGLEVGLVDDVRSLQSVVDAAEAGEFDNLKQPTHNSGKGVHMSNVLSPAAAAALAAAEAAAANPEADGGEGNALSAEELSVELTKAQGSVTDLTAKVEALTSQVADLEAAAAAAAADKDKAKATIDALAAVVASTTATMAVALGRSRPDYTGMSAEALLAEHKSVGSVFSNHFKAGGVSSADPKTTDTNASTQHDARMARAVKGTTF